MKKGKEKGGKLHKKNGEKGLKNASFWVINSKSNNRGTNNNREIKTSMYLKFFLRSRIEECCAGLTGGGGEATTCAELLTQLRQRLAV